MADLIDKTAFRRALVDRQITTHFSNLRARHEIGCIIEMLDSVPTISLEKWVSVYDKLPSAGERVLATDGAFVGEMYINKRGQWQRYNVNDSVLMMALDILWWLPMPRPPQMKGAGDNE